MIAIQRWKARWVVALGLTVVATAVNFPLQEITFGRAPLLTYFPMLTLVAFLAGALPGLAALVVTALLVAYFWVAPQNSLAVGGIADAVLLGSYLVSGLVVVAAASVARRAILGLEQTSARLDAAHVASGMVEWEWDLATNKVALSGTAGSVFGTSWTGLDGALRLAHPEDRERLETEIAEGLKAGQYRLISRMIRPDTQETRWLETIGVVHQDSSGRATHVTGTATDVTEKQRLIEKLRSADRRSRLALQSASIIAWECDADRRFTWIHSPSGRFNDVDLLGKPIDLLLAQEASQKYLDAVDRAWKSGESERLSVGWSRGGQEHCYLTSVNPITDPDGRVIGMASAAVDATLLRQAEVSAQKSEEKFLRAFVASPDSLTISRLTDGVIQEVNPSFMRLFGRTRDEVIGRSSLALGLLANPAERARSVAMLERDGRIRDLELEVRAAAGELRTVQLSVERLAEEGDDAILSIFRDVTEQRRAEAARRESENLLHLALDGARLGSWSTDLKARVSHFSARNREIFGLCTTDTRPLASEFVQTLIHPDDLPRVLEAWARAMTVQKTYHAEYRIIRPDGTQRWLESRARRHPEGDEDATHFFGITMDVTERKKAEVVLRDESVRKDEFIATLAHELRNPLTPIRYATRLFKAGTPPAMIEDLGRMIERQLSHMSRLLDDLLDASRISRGSLELRCELIDVRGVVQAAVDAARPLAEDVGHVVNLELPPDPLPAMGDATRLMQVVGNLLHNATRYTDAGGCIDVEASCTASEILVEVRDNGIGIAPEVLPSLFNLFVQGEQSRGSTGGLGIGLALAHRLIELHDGRLEGHSEGKGRGSRFRLVIPRVAERPGVSQPLATADKVTSLHAAGTRILIVDDNTDAADSLAQVLAFAGYTTKVAYEGASAIELAELFRPALVLLDLGLPNVSGHEVARRIRAEKWGRSMRLIAVTGWGREADRQKSRDAGFDDHLTKPVDPEELLAAISRTVAQNRAAEVRAQ